MDFIQEQNQIREDYKVRKPISPVIRVLRSRQTKGIIFLFVFAIVVPVLIYYFIIDRGSFTEPEDNTCSVDKTYRIRCGKTKNVTLDYCSSISCCFDNSTQLCFHYLPSKYYYFATEDQTRYKRSLNLSPFKRDLWENIQLSVNDIDENNVEITLHDANVTVPSQEEVASKNYNYTVNDNPLYVEVYRNDDSKDLLLTTAKGPTIASDNYWEWSFQLTDEYLFGLGQTLLDVDENSTITKVIYGNSKDHNTLPLFMAYKGGKYHGLVVRHSGPLEVTVLPSKLVSLKSLAGGKIVLVLSVGPTVHEVITQQRRKEVTDVDLGTLGVHICREGSSLSLSSILEDYQNEKSGYNADDSIKFRYESDCLHENLVMALRSENKNTTKEVAVSTVSNITGDGYRFILALSPQVSIDSNLYQDTTGLNVYYKQKNESEDYQGKFLQTKVVYPYFGHTSIKDFIQMFVDDLRGYFGEVLPKDFVLGYNWPTDDSFNMEEVDELQYLSESLIESMSSTLPWNVTSESHKHFLDHNDYGALQLEEIKAVFGEDNTFMTASHNFDTIEPLIIQNVDITWTNFRKAITTTLYNSIFGYPLTSIPVCGSTAHFNSSHESLCIRWYLMASTAPIFRISSASPRRDPNSLTSSCSKYAGVKANEAIEFRYSLQYYFYTVLKNNEPLMRPMFYDFPDDNETFPLVHQYMVGGSLLVAHPTLPDQSQISVYLPTGVDPWYEFWGGQAFSHSSWVTLPIVETDWVAFIPAGVIIPFVEENDVKLKVALQCDNGECFATGKLRTANSLYTFNSTDEELTIERQAGDSVEDKSFVLREATVYSTSSTNYDKTIEQNLTDISTLLYNYKFQ